MKLDGIKIFGAIGIIVSIIKIHLGIGQCNVVVNFDGFMSILTGLAWLIFSIGVFQTLNWARIGMAIITLFYAVGMFIPSGNFLSFSRPGGIIYFVYFSFVVIFYCSFTWYFLRPTVRDQFKATVKGNL